MSEVNTGGPAFPVPLLPGQSYKGHAPCDGMLLRDYFAAQAMQGLCANSEAMAATAIKAKSQDISSGEFAAKACYEMADAMLKAREAKE